MTLKDADKIARVITMTNIAPEDTPQEVMDRLADNMADMLQQDNPRFDREKFLKACGVVQVKPTWR